MLDENQHPHNKSITVSVLGKPNAGKSSLINYLLGFDLSIVTDKAQTTRNKFQCVVTIDRTEIILVDTPGIHRSNQELNKRMNEQATSAFEGSDLNLILIDLTDDILRSFQEICSKISGELGPTWIVFTKSDLIANWNEMPLEAAVNFMKSQRPEISKYFVVSPREGENMHLLTGALCDFAKPGPHLYPGGDISNRPERFFVSEYIREQAFEVLKDEIPYELAVVIDEYRDARPTKDQRGVISHISASILVNRPSQKAIVIGSKGHIIKEIGTNARTKIESLLGGQIQLNLHVKVTPKWFKNNRILEEIGLPRAKDSNRVWRAKN